LLSVGITEIHGYPLRPEGFEEPLFPTADSKRVVAEHLLEAPWLKRASEVGGSSGESAHVLEEPIELKRTHPGRAEIVRLRPNRRWSWRKKHVLRLLEHWREVREWWDEESCVDRMIFRVLISGGAVVELALKRSGEWVLTGIAD
jgi:hypothetical protein